MAYARALSRADRDPGFLRAQRWVAEGGSPRYFVVYEVADIGVLSDRPYLHCLNHSTNGRSG